MQTTAISKLSLLLFLLILSSLKVYGGTTPFVTTWLVDNEEDYLGRFGENKVIIPVLGTGYNYTVDWGDGTFSDHNGTATHTYSTQGVYKVSITGTFPKPYFLNSTRLLSIDQWGNNVWQSMENAFKGCINLKGNFTDAPDLSNVTNMKYMFHLASSFNHNISEWNVSNVTHMNGLFSEAYAFNQNIGNWNVSNVISMEEMFLNAKSFNQNIGNWNVSNVNNMKHMFSGANKFNQDMSRWKVDKVTTMEGMFLNAQTFNNAIGSWNVNKVSNMNEMFHLAVAFNQDISNWDVSNVINMKNMFSHAFLFNQDIGRWDVSKVRDMNGMFYIAESFNQDIGHWNVTIVNDMRLMLGGAISFNQDLGNWNVSNVTNMLSMLTSVELSIENYDSLLLGWSKLNLQPNVLFSAGKNQYCAGNAARNHIINTFNWSILDSGTAASIIDEIENQEGIDNYTFPEITGQNLTGNQKYFTEPNGNGIVYNTGNIINVSQFTSYPITLYAYDNDLYHPGCSSEKSFELTLMSSTLPCSSLVIPSSNSKNVSVETDFTWSAVTGAEGYKISIGSNPFKNNILELTDVGDVLNYSFFRNLPQNTTIHVKITPYNSIIENLDCQETLFTTETLTISGIPKYFTPNNDGYNDTWIVRDPLNTISYINIYSRYGKLLKQISDTSKGWDGVYLNNNLPTNDYWYTIKYKNGAFLKGHFSLKR